MLIRYLFDREDFPRLSPSPACRSRGRKRKPSAAAIQQPCYTRQLQLFIETSPGVFVPAFTLGPKRPGRKPKIKLKRAAKPIKKTKKLSRIESLMGKQYDQLTPAQVREIDDVIQKQIEERKRQVQQSWSPQQEAERCQIPPMHVEFDPMLLDGDE